MTIFEGIGWVYWMLGTFGVFGTIAALYFAPAVTIEVLKFLASFLFTTRIGNIILAASVAFVLADIRRSNIDAEDYAEKLAAANEAAKEAQAQRDKDITEGARAAVMAELARKRLAEAQIDSNVKEFEDGLKAPLQPSNPAAAAAVPDFRVGDASCRLRQIAGYAGCEPESAAGGVPKARSQGGRSRLPDWAQYRLPSIISRGPRESAQGQ